MKLIQFAGWSQPEVSHHDFGKMGMYITKSHLKQLGGARCMLWYACFPEKNKGQGFA